MHHGIAIGAAEETDIVLRHIELRTNLEVGLHICEVFVPTRECCTTLHGVCRCCGIFAA